MIKVIVPETQYKYINVDYIPDDKAIFAKQDEKLVGMIIKEEKGYILKTSAVYGSTGHHDTIKDLIEYNHRELMQEFYIEG